MNPVPQQKGVGTQLYTGAADVGKIWATISAVLATVVAVGMVLGGIYIIYHRSHLKYVTGKVTKSSYNCVKQSTKNGAITTCKVNVSYSIDGKSFMKTFTSSTLYKVGDDVDVYYDPTDPKDTEINPIPKWIGWALIGGAAFIVVSSWIWVWLVNRYKFLAAAQGVKGVVDLFR